MATNAAIEQFLAHYEREQDYYLRVADLCGRQIERGLRQANIRAITTWRAKKLSSLRDKLTQRNAKRVQQQLEYLGDSDIVADIPDLAGARIALYFPGDLAGVDQLIRAHFRLACDPKAFPEAGPRKTDKKFFGYEARHYRVHLREDEVLPGEQRFCAAVCEIQVASVLMHAWAEVEHDLEYKAISGPISASEGALLDQINGLVVAGDIALSQLQQSIRRRLGEHDAELRDHYDLASWLLQMADGVRARVSAEGRRVAGRAEAAFRMLRALGMTKVVHLTNVRRRIESILEEDSDETPLADLLIDALLEEDPERATAAENAIQQTVEVYTGRIPDPRSSLAAAAFITRWESFVWMLRVALLVSHGQTTKRGATAILDMLGVSDSLRKEIAVLHDNRNRIVHRSSPPDNANATVAATHRLETVASEIVGAALEPVYAQLGVSVENVLRHGSTTGSQLHEFAAMPVEFREESTLVSAKVYLLNVSYWARMALVSADGATWASVAWNVAKPEGVRGSRFVLVFPAVWFVFDQARRAGLQTVRVELAYSTDGALRSVTADVQLNLAEENLSGRPPPRLSIREA